MSERPASYTIERPCMFCQGPADHVGIDGAYVVNCGACGTMYEVAAGFYTLATTGRKEAARMEHWRAAVVDANRAGFRLTIPAGQRVPLE